MEAAVMCPVERVPGRAVVAGVAKEPSCIVTQPPARARPDRPFEPEESDADAVARAIGEGGNIG